MSLAHRFPRAIISLSILGLLLGAAKAGAAGGDLLATIANPDPYDFESFGAVIAPVAGNLIIGAPLDDLGLGSVHLVNGTTGALIRTIDNPEPATSDYFGAAVAAIGANIIVGGPNADTDGQDSGRVYVFDGTNGNLLLTIVDPSPESGGNFGNSVAAVGANILVGAPNKAGGGLSRGLAYLFNGTTGALLQTFTNPLATDGAQFGTTVAAVGSACLITAPGQTISGHLAAGEAFIFDTAGVLQTSIPNPTPGSGDYFGQSVAVNAGTIIIGAPFNTTTLQGAGSVYSYTGAGVLQFTIDNPAPAVFEGFGLSVAVNGTYLVVGNPNDDDDGNGAGSISIFDVTTGQFIFRLPNPDPLYNDQFGFAVAIVNNNFAVGAPFDDEDGFTESGIAYIFDGTGAFPTPSPSPTPTPSPTISASPTASPTPTATPGPNDTIPLYSGGPRQLGRFGEAIFGLADLNGDKRGEVIIGAQGESDTPFINTTSEGRAHVYDGVTGQRLYSLRSPNESDYGYFGHSVGAISDLNRDCAGEFVIGAPGEEPLGRPANSGAAYIWNGTTGLASRMLVSPNPQIDGGFGFATAGLTDTNLDKKGDVVVTAVFEDGVSTPTVRRGRAYIFDGSNGNVLHTLDSPNPITDGRFGWAVAAVPDLDGDRKSDIAISAPGEDGASVARAGRAYIFSGGSGVLLHTLSSTLERSTGSFGYSIAGIPDIDGDGKGDVIVGATAEPVSASGRVYVFSGGTGNLIRVLQAGIVQNAAFFGFAVAGTSDLDGDGKPEILASAIDEDIPGQDAGKVYLYSGATGALIRSIISPNPAGRGGFGSAIAGMTDYESDGRSYATVAAHFESSIAPTSGRAYIFKTPAPVIPMPTDCEPYIPSAVQDSWTQYD